jgi:hypothetical protein
MRRQGLTGDSMMKTTLLLFVAISSLAAFAPPLQNAVQVALGPKAYRDGDCVEITHVTATSARLEQGDSVTIRGRVRLDSRSSAQLGLYLTQTQGNGSEETDPGQTLTVSRGLADFELKTTIKHRGYLHLTLYDTATRKPLGGVYFGTPDQMQQIATWNVSYYLTD